MKERCADDAFHVRASMTFSESAHPGFVAMLRSLPPRARSRLIHTLVERALALGVAPGHLPEQAAFTGSRRSSGQAADVDAVEDQSSPFTALGPAGSLAGAEELGA